MKTYLVGGAVRDFLLGINSHDNDWVVVGSTPEAMLANGFRPVGQDFPVFLHPKTQEEYALARTERKSGHGYSGFDCFFSADVTLEEDLARRDLTINAIAQDNDGTLIDPYHGEKDISERLLRHVSPAFSDDPLRVLRIARFKAQLSPFGFQIADETMALMKRMVASGELKHLTAERIWQEWHKSLMTGSPDIFLEVLRECGALSVILPEIDVLFGVPQPEKWHPEIDTGIHTLLVAKQAANISRNPLVRFAAQLHDLGKGITPKEEWPSHKMHCHSGLTPIKTLCERLRVPNDYRDLALLVCQYHTNIHDALSLKPSTIIKIFDAIDVWRKPERLPLILQTCQADSQGRTGFENASYPQSEWLLRCFEQANSVEVASIIEQGFAGAKIREELTRQRIQAVHSMIKSSPASI